MNERLLSRVAIAMLAASLDACIESPRPEVRVYAGDANRGEAVLASLQCGACHSIPGVAGAVGQVGPPLDAFATRPYIAGKFPNQPELLVRWLLDPPALAPQTGMPAVPMSEQDARDMAAYLYELR
ncbi:MAG TPA: c-type cytochrome [Steroidobacteraceae bacterium]